MKNAARAFCFAAEATMADVRRLVELAGYHVRTGANLERGQTITERESMAYSKSSDAGPAVPRTTSSEGVVNTSETSGGQPLSNIADIDGDSNRVESRVVTISRAGAGVDQLRGIGLRLARASNRLYNPAPKFVPYDAPMTI